MGRVVWNPHLTVRHPELNQLPVLETIDQPHISPHEPVCFSQTDIAAVWRPAPWPNASQPVSWVYPVLDGVRTSIQAGFAVLVPAGTNHNIVNTGDVPLKLYTLYAPPNHRDGVVHQTRADAQADTEHFDGKTTE